MAANKGDKKARKAAAKKRDKLTRRPKQKGKVKKAQSHNSKPVFFMRSELPVAMKREQESERLQHEGISPAVARNIAAWRAKRNLV
jgi:hypothetical protein